MEVEISVVLQIPFWKFMFRYSDTRGHGGGGSSSGTVSVRKFDALHVEPPVCRACPASKAGGSWERFTLPASPSVHRLHERSLPHLCRRAAHSPEGTLCPKIGTKRVALQKVFFFFLNERQTLPVVCHWETDEDGKESQSHCDGAVACQGTHHCWC